MKYQIQYFYQTGDSFGNEDTNGILELGWENLDVAKQNLQRIKDHYQMYNEIENMRRGDDFDVIINKYQDKDWFVGENRTLIQNCIKLYADNGNVFQMWAPWCGYFETLHFAKIILECPIDNDMEFYA